MSATSDTSKALVIFGSAGDLALKKLFPALFRLFRDGNIPANLSLIAATHSAISQEHFAEKLTAHIPEVDQQVLTQFIARIDMVPCDVTDLPSIKALAQHLDGIAVKMYYFAIPPKLFGTLTENLNLSGCLDQHSRVVVEKPLGHDLKSAKVINNELCSHLDESQIFRIDHYLGKEAVQNLMALRFGNAIFEPLWRAARIRYIQITVAETVGVEDRAGFYDRSGALRDMVQNHLLQLLCILAMEPPTVLSPDTVRTEKLKVLQALKVIMPNEVVNNTVRGQYITNGDLPGYLDERGVADQSQTETFVALKAEIDNWRWAGMPIYLRTGKCMHEKLSEVVVQFSDVPVKLFKTSGSQMLSNRLVIRLQPKESIKLFVNAKSPGRGMSLESNALNLDYGERPSSKKWTAYERLFLDIIAGDLTLFLKATEIEAAWSWIDPIISGWEQFMPNPEHYRIGSWGPPASDQLLAKDGHIWFNSGQV